MSNDAKHILSQLRMDGIGYIYGVGAFQSKYDEYASAVLKLHPF